MIKKKGNILGGLSSKTGTVYSKSQIKVEAVRGICKSNFLQVGFNKVKCMYKH